MDKTPFIVGILALGILSGIFSPLTFLMHVWLQGFYPSFFLGAPTGTLFVSALLTATVVIALGGIPAALYERIRGLEDSNGPSMGIWLGATSLIAFPALARIFNLA